MKSLKVGQALEHLRNKGVLGSGRAYASPPPRQDAVKKLEQTSFIHSFVGHENAND